MNLEYLKNMVEYAFAAGVVFATGKDRPTDSSPVAETVSFERRSSANGQVVCVAYLPVEEAELHFVESDMLESSLPDGAYKIYKDLNGLYLKGRKDIIIRIEDGVPPQLKETAMYHVYSGETPITELLKNYKAVLIRTAKQGG